MKRLWIGILILSLLLAGGICLHLSLLAVHPPIAQALEQAATAAMQDDWPLALQRYEQAAARWQKYHRFTAAFADHTPMDEVDGLFAQLAILAQKQENPHFSATCRQISTLAYAIGQSHGLSWWNLL